MNSMQKSWQNSYLFGSNSSFIEQMYENYLADKNSVDSSWAKYFAAINENDISHRQTIEKFTNFSQNNQVMQVSDDSTHKFHQLAEMYRAIGHIYAKINPLKDEITELPQELTTKHYNLENSLNNQYHLGDSYLKLTEIITKLNQTYLGSVGFEYKYISNLAENLWLQNYIESKYTNYQLTKAEKIQILQKLTEAQGMEKFLHVKYVGQKRFSLEGGESLIPALDRLLQVSIKNDIDDVTIGMAHRGRLNVLTNILGKSPQEILNEFDGKYAHKEFVTSMDVKYHKGYICDYIIDDKKINVELLNNPSHLEIINPVTHGVVRAKQDSQINSLGILIHGDSAFIGLGTNQGQLNMSQTYAYGVNGIIHIVINNQVGFTNSNLKDNRSSRYCTDIAKMIEAPIVHVNADDVEKLLFVIDLALEYRNKFKKDFIIDLVCFRRYGHNEADDPTLTQPLMYSKIKQHPGVLSIYTNKLTNEGIINENVAATMQESYSTNFAKGIHLSQEKMRPKDMYTKSMIDQIKSAKLFDAVNTKITLEQLVQFTNVTTDVPDNFIPHPTIKRSIDNRKAMAAAKQAIDFGMAETLAYASLLNTGISIRLTGEDSARGTFSHRHAVWHSSDSSHIPLKKLEHNSCFSVYDSVLNEECVLGFEYGYSTHHLQDLVIWEAQFGDFANGAQVIIDQFIASAEAKWGLLSNLTLILPHGYDGQGPEHSSARIERFLQLCAEDNCQIVVPSTASQMFHILKRQALSNLFKPLVIFMSKKLLRFKDAMSKTEDFITGEFNFVIDNDSNHAQETNKVILCSGQIYYDIIKKRQELNLTEQVAVIRLEQLYPFPLKILQEQIAKYKNAIQFIWAQEEPYNQGAWLQIRENLINIANFKPVARHASAAPACGTTYMHNREIKELLTEIFI